MASPVEHDAAREQSAVITVGATAKPEYELAGDRMLLLHTEVPEDWWWCHAFELFFELDGAPAAPSRP